MFKRHVSKNLSAYCNGELSAEKCRAIGEHLLSCRRCRLEYDEIKLGVELARQLPQVSAPDTLWTEIETVLDGLGNRTSRSFAHGFGFHFGRYRIAAAVTVALLVLGIAAALYYSRRSDISDKQARDEPEQSVPVSPKEPHDEKTPDQNQPERLPELAPKSPGLILPDRRQNILRQPNLAWNVDSLQGEPRVNSEPIKGKGQLGVGEWLETDGWSRAKIDVADIGQVEVHPNSRIQLVRTRATEHRLALARGTMHATILAPPRLFFVNTPSAVAIDYGCVYTLTVDEGGGSRLDVETGWVMLVARGRESKVPAGGTCITRPGQGPGTPYFDDASARFLDALTRFDFERGGREALTELLAEARERDTLTLIQLLHRTQGPGRRLVYDRLAEIAPPPQGVTREGVLRLEPTMLELWMMELTWLW